MPSAPFKHVYLCGWVSWHLESLLSTPKGWGLMSAHLPSPYNRLSVTWPCKQEHDYKKCVIPLAFTKCNISSPYSNQSGKIIFQDKGLWSPRNTEYPLADEMSLPKPSPQWTRPRLRSAFAEGIFPVWSEVSKMCGTN